MPLTLAETTSIYLPCVFCFSTTSVFKNSGENEDFNRKVGYHNHQDFRGYDVTTLIFEGSTAVKPRMPPGAPTLPMPRLEVLDFEAQKLALEEEAEISRRQTDSEILFFSSVGVS